MTEVTALFSETTIGIDLGDHYSYACALNHGGDVAQRFRFPTTREGFGQAFEGRTCGRLVVEVGTHSPWVSWDLGAGGHEHDDHTEIDTTTEKAQRGRRLALPTPVARAAEAQPSLVGAIEIGGTTPGASAGSGPGGAGRHRSIPPRGRPRRGRGHGR